MKCHHRRNIFVGIENNFRNTELRHGTWNMAHECDSSNKFITFIEKIVRTLNIKRSQVTQVECESMAAL